MNALPPQPPADLKESKNLGQNAKKSVEERLDELEILIRQNMQWSEIIYKDIKKIRRRLFVTRVWGWIKIGLFLAPLVAAIIFIPPYIREVKQWYEENIETPRMQLENKLNSINRYIPNSN